MAGTARQNALGFSSSQNAENWQFLAISCRMKKLGGIQRRIDSGFTSLTCYTCENLKSNNHEILNIKN